MKKKLIPVLLSVVLIVALIVPIASATSTTLVACNPLGDIAIQTNIPLTSRERFINAAGNIDFTGKRVGLSSYTKSRNAQALAALGELLKARYPEVTIVTTTALGSPWNNKTDANYTTWAGLDAVIFGVAD
ncbi:MAG: hypothetical protein LBH28_09345 [Oscillospiraceae bacterium]|jgi:hypothetical protein|nr:hypothetical protein [Oscillospiraceae bacterium]